MANPLDAKAKEMAATNSQIKDIYQRNSLYPRTGKRGPKTQARITLAELDALLTRIMLAETQQTSQEAEDAAEHLRNNAGLFSDKSGILNAATLITTQAERIAELEAALKFSDEQSEKVEALLEPHVVWGDDRSENTTDNPKSWIAWKARALAAKGGE